MKERRNNWMVSQRKEEDSVHMDSETTFIS